MVVIQSWWGGSNPTSNFYYSPDRVNFYQISSTFPSEYLHQYNFYDSPRVTSENRMSFGINDRHENEMHLWELRPRVFVDEIVRNAGFPNAFSPHLIAPDEVVGLTQSKSGNSVTISWTNPNHPDF